MKSTELCSKLLVFALMTNNFYHPPEADASVLHIDPNKLQFFEYESINLSCSGSADWRVIQASTSTATIWENSPRSLKIYPAFVQHSGVYWCEDKEGEKSNTLNITVTAGDVILESPAVPVMEGQTVTLSCKKRQSSLSSAADFYKDGLFEETKYNGEMILSDVSWSSEGLYKCLISGAGESAESRLSVRASYSTTERLDVPSSSGGEETAGPSSLPPAHIGSSQLTTSLSVFFSVLFVAFLLSLTGFLHHRKRKAKRVNTETSAGESDPVYENARRIDSDMTIYAGVPTQKNKRGRLDNHERGVHGKRKNKRATRASSEASTLALTPLYENSGEIDPNMTVYASVSKHRY